MNKARLSSGVVVVSCVCTMLMGCASTRWVCLETQRRTTRISTLVQYFWALPVWPIEHRSFHATEWQHFVDTAALIQRCRADDVREALAKFVSEVTTNRPPGPGAPESKVFLLLRVVFDLPDDAPIVERRSYVGWMNWPDGDNGRVNLAWPIEWNEGRPRLIDRCVGRVGGPYDAPAEYEYFLAKYRFRDLEHLACKER